MVHKAVVFRHNIYYGSRHPFSASTTLNNIFDFWKAVSFRLCEIHPRSLFVYSDGFAFADSSLLTKETEHNQRTVAILSTSKLCKLCNWSEIRLPFMKCLQTNVARLAITLGPCQLRNACGYND